MGLHRFKPMPSGRMGILWTLSGIREAAIVEFGCMGHNLYSRAALRRAGIYEGFGAAIYTTYVDETDMQDIARAVQGSIARASDMPKGEKPTHQTRQDLLYNAMRLWLNGNPREIE